MKKIFFLLTLTILSITPFSQQIPQDKKLPGVSCGLKEVILAEQKVIAACAQ